ncbi:hypothetical protein N0V90_012204 [Kalmusia sp. IMI 367209]|nr:hypothetical protein N0V90_012204 [Kalmusia sp. IMI 367209]
MAATTPEDPEPQAERPECGYNIFYENIALFPELARFRRFAAEWSKLLHDDTQEVQFLRNQARVELGKKIIQPAGGVDVLDIPRSVVKDAYPEIYKNFWKPYEEALRQQGKDPRSSDLCTSHEIMNLPDQPAYATKFVAKFGPPVFENGRFGITQELKEFYLDPSQRQDACAWRMLPQEDYLMRRVLQMSPWIEENISKRFAASRASQSQSSTQASNPPYYRHHVLVETIDILTCIFVSVLLMGTMFALAHIRALNARIGVVGGMGIVFSLCVKLLGGSPSRRIEVYAATAAFFAVASVFVSNVNQ